MLAVSASRVRIRAGSGSGVEAKVRAEELKSMSTKTPNDSWCGALSREKVMSESVATRNAGVVLVEVRRKMHELELDEEKSQDSESELLLPLKESLRRCVQSRPCRGSTAVATIESSRWPRTERVVKLYEVPGRKLGVVLLTFFRLTRGRSPDSAVSPIANRDAHRDVSFCRGPVMPDSKIQGRSSRSLILVSARFEAAGWLRTGAHVRRSGFWLQIDRCLVEKHIGFSSILGIPCCPDYPPPGPER